MTSYWIDEAYPPHIHLYGPYNYSHTKLQICYSNRHTIDTGISYIPITTTVQNAVTQKNNLLQLKIVALYKKMYTDNINTI